MSDILLAVDGGNVKTDLALVSAAGELVGFARGGRSSPHHVGVAGAVNVLAELLHRALAGTGIDPERPELATAQILIAGADLPEEEAALHAALAALGWTERLVVENDMFALLRSGTDRGWGVGIVCGGGMNCVGVTPDGRVLRFPALGPITGDWGGGVDVGLAALGAAARGVDGRGSRTVLETAVPAQYGLLEPIDVARAIHLGQMPIERLGELAPVVYAAAADDPAAAAIVQRIADEVLALAAAALRRLNLLEEEADVVLGGSLLRAAPSWAIEWIADQLHDIALNAKVLVARSAPIVGAALLGLDQLGAGGAAAARARAELDGAVSAVEAGDGRRPAAAPEADGRVGGVRG